VSGTHRLHVTIDGVHVLGSPTPLTLAAAAPDVPHCSLLGDGLGKAVAGARARLEVHLKDSYGNEATSPPGLTYGLVLLPLPSNEKGAKGGKAAGKAGGGKSGAGARELSGAGDVHGAESDVIESYAMPAISKPPAKLSAAERANLAKTLPSISFDGEARAPNASSPAACVATAGPNPSIHTRDRTGPLHRPHKTESLLPPSTTRP
jgi:hypothetical protein